MSIVCGNSAHRSLREYLAVDGGHWRRVQVHHATTDEVRRCFAAGPDGIQTLEDDQLQAEARAEAEAEAGYERWLEDGGPHAASIQAEAEMERRREDAMGVVPFEDAMAEAERGSAMTTNHENALAERRADLAESVGTDLLPNRGFVYESGDPSVGLFGHAWSHEDCPEWETWTIGASSPDAGEVDEQQLAVTRVNAMTVRTWYLLTCRDCGMQALVNQDDYSPTDEAEAEMARAEVEAWQAEAYADAMAAQYDDDPSPYAGTYSEE
jgi:hypothetical protein